MPEQNVSYYATFSTLLPLETGDIHLFGTYPQSLVTGGFFKSTLNTIVGTLPSSENSQLWTDYGYYINGEITSFLWCIDIAYEREKYRGVHYTDYRPK